MTVDYKPNVTFTISASGQTSDEVDLPTRHGLIGIVSPSAVDGDTGSPAATHARLLGSVDGVTYVTVWDRVNDVPVTVPLDEAAGRGIGLDPLYTAMFSHLKLQVVGSSKLTPITQTAERVFIGVMYEV